MEYSLDNRQIKICKELHKKKIDFSPNFIDTQIIDEFFEQHEDMDICLILNGSWSYKQRLTPYLETHNVLLYRPKFSYKHEIERSYLKGIPQPSNSLLLFDVDKVKGYTLRETSDFLKTFGYEEIFVYLCLGDKSKNEGWNEELGRLKEFI